MKKSTQQKFKVSGEHLLKKVKQLIKAGNARLIIIKNEKGVTLVELPVTIGAIGVLLAPALAAIGAIAALVTKCTVVVVKR